MNIGEYNPINFDEISDVLLVDYDDDDYQKWKKQTYKEKITESQKRRKHELYTYPKEVDLLKHHFYNKKCINCKYCDKNKFGDGYVCWGFKIGLRPTTNINIKKDRSLCEKYEFQLPFHLFKNIHITPRNLKYYLHDIGLGGKPKNPILKAKEKENKFRKLLEKTRVKIINKIFKIVYKDNAISFKIPDFIIKKDNKISIIEYKSNAHTGDFQQIIDYGKLYYLSELSEIDNLYWIVNSHELYTYIYLDDLYQKSKETLHKHNIKIFSDREFLNIIDGKTGLDAWM